MPRITAAVLPAPGEALDLREIDLDRPRADEVLVRLVATGVCHSDIAAQDGAYGISTPLVLGHEGSGIVEEVGPGVSSVAAGDHVVLSFASCGHCDRCRTGHPVYCRTSRQMNQSGCRADGTTAYRDGDDVVYGHFIGQSSFATHALVRDTAVVKVDDDVPFELLAALACGVQTGAATVINQMRPRPGDSLAVVGTGAVGLSAVMAAAALGVTTIVAVDTNEGRLDLARRLGASAAIPVRGDTDFVQPLLEETGGHGVTFAIDTTAVPAVVEQLFTAVDVLGTLSLLGSFRAGTQLTLDARTALRGRRIAGDLVGDAVPNEMIGQLLALQSAGRLPLELMVTPVGGLSDINEAMDMARTGSVVKAVVALDR